MSAFEKALAFTLQYEGGYVNHPNDRGGPTKYGVTERFARAHGYTGRMQDLPMAMAQQFYRESIWDRYKFDEVAAVDSDCAAYLFDMAVNHGRWTLIAQRAAQRYVTLSIDGAWGPETHGALIKASAVPGFLDALRVERCRYGEWIVSKDRSQEVFLVGWLRRWLA